MKKSLALAVAGALLSTAVIATDDEDLSYMIGSDIGGQLKANAIDVDVDALVEGLTNALNGGQSRLSATRIQELQSMVQQRQQAARQKMQQEMQERIAVEGKANAEQGSAFLAANAAKDGVSVTASGLQYRVISEGAGKKPASTDRVRVHYRGTLVDGTEFDSSYSRNEPTEFPLDGVIPGWTEGLQLMTVGSKYEFVIPHELAYGERGGGSIPPSSTLVFEVELLDVL